MFATLEMTTKLGWSHLAVALGIITGDNIASPRFFCKIKANLKESEE